MERELGEYRESVPASLVGYGKFVPVTYDDHTAELIINREYLVTEEVLMPAAEVRRLAADTLDEVHDAADTFKVTPSAFVMRARRLQLIDRDQADRHFAALSAAFAQRDDVPPRRPNPFNAIRRYSDFCRVVCLNKIKPNQIPDFRAALVAAR